MSKKKKVQQKTGNGEEPHSHGNVLVDFFGVTLLLPKEKKMVLVDGRKPRKSQSEAGSIIPGHFAFIAVESGKYKAFNDKKEPVARVINFSYDLDGVGPKTSLDAFVLEGHKVTFEGFDDGTGDINTRQIAEMKSLAGELELCPGVRTGDSKQVVGFIDLSKAASVAGSDHGEHSGHQIRFGSSISNVAEKVTATFALGHDTPVIRMRNGDENTNLRIEIQEPCRVMVGNVPAEEVMDLNSMPDGKEVPLTHIELLYDLYHCAPSGQLKVPLCTDHKMHAAGGHTHAHPMVAGGHCGPPMQPGGGG